MVAVEMVVTVVAKGVIGELDNPLIVVISEKGLPLKADIWC
jgi:hypothetical protein